jgi:uncharacterized protein
MFFVTAITLGFFSSFHCIAMCGPLALSLPVHHLHTLPKLVAFIMYNGGRAVTYSIGGCFAGALGQAFAVAGFQQTLTISVGFLILLSLFFNRGKTGRAIFRFSGESFFRKLRALLSKVLLFNNKRSFLAIGLLNGLLPCGMVYMALAGAIATGSAIKGALFMLSFGLGTTPVMLSLPLANGFITIERRRKLGRSIPVVIAITAVLMILRGLNLGIPYISPELDAGKNTCHTVNTSTKAILCTGHSSLPNR